MPTPFKEQLPKRVFSEQDFKGSDTLGRIRISYIDGNYKLNNRDQNYADKLHEVFQILCKHTRQIVAAREIRRHFDNCSHQMVNKMISDVQLLYSDITERNELWDAINRRERLLRHIERCELLLEMDNVARFEKLVGEVEKRISELKPIEAVAKTSTPTIYLSTDLSLLSQNINKDYEDEEE